MCYIFRAALLAAFVLSLSLVAVVAEANGEADVSKMVDAGAGVAENVEDAGGMDGTDDEPTPKSVMKEMDKDGDGFLSLLELTDHEEMREMKDEKRLIEKAFNTADADKDGKLSFAELPVAMKEYESLSEAEDEDAENKQNAENQRKIADVDGIMKNMDKDNDGFLSLVEVMSRADESEMEEKEKKIVENAFNTADSDKDGKLSVAEFPVAVKEFNSLSEAEDEDTENQEDIDMHGKEDELLPDDIMRDMDKDKDGFLSLVELMSEEDGEMEEKEKKRVEKAFNIADLDKDGKLSVAELPVAMKEFESASVS